MFEAKVTEFFCNGNSFLLVFNLETSYFCEFIYQIGAVGLQKTVSHGIVKARHGFANPDRQFMNRHHKVMALV